ncbi:MAG TPA: carboxypeptidase regulatory-like domain-containing protein [Granulicella sp.]
MSISSKTKFLKEDLVCQACCLIVGMILMVQVALGQGAVGGRISGRVTDPSGAVIPDATISAQNTGTDVVIRSKSNDSGYYVMQVPAGRYNVTVGATGFGTVVLNNLVVLVGSDAGGDVHLTVASAESVVEVHGEASQELITPNSSQTQTSVDNEMVASIPVEVSGTLRNASAFLKLEPGYNGTSLNGGAANDQAITVDGADVSAVGFGSGGESISYAMPVPSFAVQEFQVVGSNQDANVGRTSTGGVTYALKSGTNSFHGSVFEFNRNTIYDAKSYFQKVRGQDHQNEFGFDVGGPIWKNRTFFYGYYDGYRYKTSNTGMLYSLLTPAMKTGDFSAPGIPAIYDPSTTVSNGSGGFTRQQFQCNGRLNVICPERLSSVSRYFASLYPNPQTLTLSNNFVGTTTSTTNSDQFLIKIDHTISDSQRISGSYAQMYNPQTSNGPFGVNLSGGTTNPYRGNRAIVNYNTTINANMLNHALGSFDILYFNSHTGGQNNYNSGANLNQMAGLTGVNQTGFARINVGGALTSNGTIGAAGTYYVGGGSNLNKIAHTVYRLSDEFSWQKGNHQMQFGASYLHYYTIGEQGAYGSGNWGTFQFSPQETGLPGSSSSGFAAASFMLGELDGGGLGQNPSQAMSMPYQGYFAQDKWKILPNLTLTAGLRWDYSSPITDRGDRLANFDPSVTNAAAGNLPGALVFAGFGAGKANRHQFADPWYGGWGPRVGISWAVSSNTVLRAAYGLLYDTNNGPAAKLNQQGYFTQSTLLSTNGGVTPAFNWTTGFPTVKQGPLFDPTFANGSSSSRMTPGGAIQPQVENYTVGIQQRLPGGFVLDAAYVGTQGHHMQIINVLNLNQMDPKYLSLGNVLSASIGSAQANAAGIRAPYPGFTGNVAQALRPFPQYQTITDTAGPLGNQHYNAFQAKVQKAFTHGYTVLASYTYEKNITNVNTVGAQNYYDLHAESAVASFDIPHAFTAAYNWQLPIGKGQKLNIGNATLDKIFGGWMTSGVLTLKSGTPISVTTETSLPGIGPVLPNVVSGQALLGTNASRGKFTPSRDRYLNSAAFALPPAFSFGTAPRYFDNARTFGYEDWDVALTKRWAFDKRFNFDLKGEFFNVLNRTNFAGPNADMQSPAFGQVTAIQANTTPRNGQVSGTISW